MKRNSNKKHTGIYIAIGIAVVLVALAAVGIIAFNLYFKPKILEPMQQIQQISESEPESENLFSSDILLNELESVLREEDISEYINQENPTQTSELITAIEDARERNRQKKADTSTPVPEKTSEPQTSKEPEKIDEPQKTQTPTQAPKPTAKQSKYDKYKDQVDPKDLKDAISLAGKVDAGYVLGLVGGGLTAENKSELKKYLMSRLSSSEISRGIQLFAKYSYLL